MLAVFFSFLCLGVEQKLGGPFNLKIEDLKVDSNKNPVGLDHERPVFSWKIASSDYAVYQKAYQIKVYQADYVTDQKKLVWDSGKVRSSDTTNISYQGRDLQSACVYEWQLAIWDEHNYKHEASGSNMFETAYVSEGQPFENCEFIAVDDRDLSVQGLPVFVKTFGLEKKTVKKAYYYGASLGIYDAYINGERIGGDPCEELKSGWTNYDKSLLYNTYDITKMFNGKRQTEYTMAVMLGKG